MVNYKIVVLLVLSGIFIVIAYQQQIGIVGYSNFNRYAAMVNSSSADFKSFLNNSGTISGFDAPSNLTVKLVENPLYVMNFVSNLTNIMPSGNRNVSYYVLSSVPSQLNGGSIFDISQYLFNNYQTLSGYSLLISLYISSLVNIAYPIGTAAPSQQTDITSQSIDYSKFGLQSPLSRYLTIVFLAQLGIPVINESMISNTQDLLQQARSGRLVPFKTYYISSLYELEFAGTAVENIGNTENYLISCGIFNSSNTTYHESMPIDSELYSSSFSNAQTQFYNPGAFGTTTGTGLTGYAPTTIPVVAELLSVATQVNPTIINKFVDQDVNCNPFYNLSFDEYQSDMLQQLIYNKEIQPSIAYVGYSNGAMVVDVDSLNLNSTKRIGFTIDNNSVNYTRYLNFLFARVNLTNGYHFLSLYIGNTTMESTIFVEPYMPITITSSSYNLTISIFNTTYPDANITDFSVTDEHGNVLTYPNFSLDQPTTIRLQTSSSCNAGSSQSYTIDFNTNYGKEQLISSVQCT